MTEARPFEDLLSSGLLWLINISVFHPRGFALSITIDGDDKAIGWSLMGDGTEPWYFDGPHHEKFNAVEVTFRQAATPVRAVDDRPDPTDRNVAT